MNQTTYARYTFEQQHQGAVIVYGWGTYAPSSVLAGQPKKVFIDSYDSIDIALKEHPTAQGGGKYTDPQVSLNHLPCENDPIVGGMYPDDYGDGF
jgi:hypothetical protein